MLMNFGMIWKIYSSKILLTICIVEPTSVIKPMRDFVANDATDGTEVEVPWYLVNNH